MKSMLALAGAGCLLTLVVCHAQVQQRAAALLPWRPALVTSWQWQLSGPLDTSIDAEMYDVDLFDTPASAVRALHAAGRKVVCYISAGTWEDWRPDKDAFPASVIGRDYAGWPGERWLDIRQIDLLAPIMRARLDQCRDKGFDAVEPDNVDAYLNDSGFPLTADDQLLYNRWFADEAHARGLSVGLKNLPEQAAALVAHFDWALTEDCVAEGWCEQMGPFLRAGKPVFAAEYTDTGMTIDWLCEAAPRLQLNAILKRRALDSFREACPAAATPSALLRDFVLPTPLFDMASAWNQRAAEAPVLRESHEQMLHVYRVLLGDRTSLVGAPAPRSAYPFPSVSVDDWAVPIARARSGQPRVALRDYERGSSGVPLLAGVLVPEDVERGVIDHALVFSIPGPRNTNTAAPRDPRPGDYVYPASTTNAVSYSASRDALAMGQRIRLRRDIVDDQDRLVDEATLRPITRRVLTALRTYGAYLVDHADRFVFAAEDVHTADLRLTEREVNALIGRPAATPLPADKTRWQLVLEALNDDLGRIPLASGPWRGFGPGGRNPTTARFIRSNFEVVEPARAPAGAAHR